MNNKMVKLAHKIFDLFGRYIGEYYTEVGNTLGFVYIKSKITKEICCFAQDIETLKANVAAIRSDGDGI
jgi:hypothetical protein